MNNIHFFTTETGRLGNLLFVCLHAYVLSKTKKSIFVNLDDSKQLNKELLNIGEYYFNKKDIANLINIYKTNIQLYKLPYGVNWQEAFMYYTIDDILNFTRRTLAQSPFLSNLIKTKTNLDTCCSIHIRATDYFDDKNFNNFYIDRPSYIKKAFNYIPLSVTELDVYSDDIEYTKTNFDKLFKSRFSKVNYMPNNSADEDILRLSCYKYKILFNSSFSHWSAYIAQCIFRDVLIICPYKYCGDPEISKYKTPSIGWILL